MIHDCDNKKPTIDFSCKYEEISSENKVNTSYLLLMVVKYADECGIGISNPNIFSIPTVAGLVTDLGSIEPPPSVTVPDDPLLTGAMIYDEFFLTESCHNILKCYCIPSPPPPLSSLPSSLSSSL
uniref:Uncharacterized protein n=1 Tax=Glossina pallidipes TaxID=7398 RepID=A0A1B0A664_GLOPL